MRSGEIMVTSADALARIEIGQCEDDRDAKSGTLRD
jgi:hypothetical protein